MDSTATRIRNGLSNAPPWSLIPSPFLRKIADVDPQQIAIWRWRGKFPAGLPTDWFKRRATWSFVADILNWAGDARPFRQQLEEHVKAHGLAIFGNHVDPVEAIVQLEKLGVIRSHPVPMRWTSCGKAKWLDEIRRRASTTP